MHFVVCDSDDQRTEAGSLMGRAGCHSPHWRCLRTHGAWRAWWEGGRGGVALSTDIPRSWDVLSPIMWFHGAGCGFWCITLVPRGHSRSGDIEQKIIMENLSYCNRAELPKAGLLLLRIPGTVLLSPDLRLRASLLPRASVSECPLGSWPSLRGTQPGMVSISAKPHGRPMP